MTQIIAAIMFFTRLPLWKVANVPSEYFKNIVAYWPLSGWLTAGIMTLTLYASSLILSPSVAIVLTILSRVLLTGALHEDGLADFIDGFGGGTSKDRILAIMKDSHIGTYGVIGLVFYFGMLYTIFSSLPLSVLGGVILTADPFCKGVSSMIINRLPYVRKEEEAKSKTVYSKMNVKEIIFCALFSLASLLWLPSNTYLLSAIPVVLVFLLLIYYMRKKIGGYTGDCCGAVFLICELCFYAGCLIIYEKM
jgi:adenosylcobinamide-GDP ribazoletransferase